MKFTTDRSALAPIVIGLGALSLLPSVEAAFAECVAGWEWSYNSKDLNPCEIAGSLQAPCLGYSVYELGPLKNGSDYLAPQKNNTEQKKCGCNTIIYSLYAACAVCQRSYNVTPNNWAFWSQYCDNVTDAQYPFPIPYNASVPHWVFLDYTGDEAFDPARAKAAGRDPEATPVAPPTVSLPSTSSSIVSSSSTTSVSSITATPISSTSTSPIPSSTSPGGPDGGGSKTNVGAIAGGVAGGVVGLAALAVLAFFLKTRGGRRNATNDILGPNQLAYNPAMAEHSYMQPKLHSPTDSSTFQNRMSGRDSTYSGGYATNPHRPVRYSGAPEL